MNDYETRCNKLFKIPVSIHQASNCPNTLVAYFYISHMFYLNVLEVYSDEALKEKMINSLKDVIKYCQDEIDIIGQ